MRKQAFAAALLVALIAAPTSASAQESPPPATSFEKVTLDDFPGEPMNLAVLPDGRVLHTTRAGEVRLHNPRTGLNTLAGKLNVYQHDEEGLQSVAVDPNFETNRWVYAYYSPPLSTPVDDPSTPVTNEGDAPETGTAVDFAPFKGYLQLSRFKLQGDTLKLDTEEKILQVPVDRGICCHVGGNIDFDATGNLFLSTGDDSNPFASDGYAPIDDSPNRNPVYDARRSAGNTNDLRGKLLRIHPKDGGGYTIPLGNLFPQGTASTKPEIYAMGLRNPFRFAVNRKNGDVYLGDYSPDAGVANPQRGPAGQGRWMLIKRPANYGWPFCATPDMPYVDYDFATKTSGEQFNCNAPTNDSPYNTGLKKLPAVAQPDVWYSYDTSPLFPELGPANTPGGIAPMGGPAYDPTPGNSSPFRFPNYFKGTPLFYEWSRDYIKEFRLNGRRLAEIRPFETFVDNPMDMEYGPDGALYVLEYGDGYFAENPDAQLAKINFVRGNHTPIPKVAADVVSGRAPLTVKFSSAGTNDPDGDPLAYAWDFEADGKVDSGDANPTHVYASNGTYRATLKVTDRTGRSASAEVLVLVGNAQPKVELTTTPPAEGPFQFGDTVTYTVKVIDDTPVDCSKVTVAFVLGHETHGHPQSSTAGCTGSIKTFLDGGHTGAANLSAVFVASYTDPGEGGTPGLTGSAQVRIVPSAGPTPTPTPPAP
ncbi:PQQ-dependent sugar dehydrogenase [Solirubrobacter ginsenosidimutans]|uniref:PQQ-dependent sugar dehydrogenase n=1 Tax=Solirubrobacter ginsenosidimutans TaxID=490573 RepID=A0A9X3S4F5_9ACTN|nr:PQQ-dependent sugar dehydrogenase [Solirubrobacter ginsenosidimutans]MDA0165749.1 PQQ-dependent sugar dehydrogenase [Solirubrobacter ginsenosidimutans]